MKLINVKISPKDLEVLRRVFGVKGGGLNFENGVFRVSSYEEVITLSEMFEIENVNWQSFDEFKKQYNSSDESSGKEQSGKKSLKENGGEAKKPEEREVISAEENKENTTTKTSEYSLEERKKIVGKRVKIGSIVRVKRDKKVVHVLITKVSSEGYQGRKLRLNIDGYNPDKEETLEKGEEVIYKNLTYKKLITVTPELIIEIKNKDIFCYQGDPIVGILISEEKKNKILNMPKDFVTNCEEMLSGKLTEEASEAKVGSECAVETPSSETTQAAEDEQQEPELESASAEHEELECAAEKNLSCEDEAEKTTVEECLEKSDLLEKFLLQTGLKGTLLELAIRLSVEDKHANMKKLLPMLQANVSNKRLTQNALKNQMNDELKELCQKGYSLKEETVTYLLKLTVKKFKN